jgi:hypothetical protein
MRVRSSDQHDICLSLVKLKPTCCLVLVKYIIFELDFTIYNSVVRDEYTRVHSDDTCDLKHGYHAYETVKFQFTRCLLPRRRYFFSVYK